VARRLTPPERWLLGRLHRRLGRDVRPHPSLGLERIGTPYGGWIVPTALIDGTWLCYCGGAGEDVSFDLGMIERFGCRVFAFDPTPRAIAFAEPIAAKEPRFRFLPVGLWSEDATLRFYAPRDPSHVSHSALNLQGTDTYFEAACRSIPALMEELGHDRLDLVKLDIEGAEHRVLASMLDAGIRPRVICTEIDQPVTPLQLWRTVRRVRRAGYELVALDAWNLTFLRADILQSEATAP
jgi:FkbM family methyltransferase